MIGEVKRMFSNKLNSFHFNENNILSVNIYKNNVDENQRKKLYGNW